MLAKRILWRGYAGKDVERALVNRSQRRQKRPGERLRDPVRLRPSRDLESGRGRLLPCRYPPFQFIGSEGAPGDQGDRELAGRDEGGRRQVSRSATVKDVSFGHEAMLWPEPVVGPLLRCSPRKQMSNAASCGVHQRTPNKSRQTSNVGHFAIAGPCINPATADRLRSNFFWSTPSSVGKINKSSWSLTTGSFQTATSQPGACSDSARNLSCRSDI